MSAMKELRAVAAREGVPEGLVGELALPAMRLVATDAPDVVGASRLGGLPDLPVGMEWPRWDTTAYDEKQRPDVEARAHEVRRRSPVPLSFLAQLDLEQLASFEHGLPLPERGHLYFFYELEEQVWGYCPTHRGAFRVLFAPHTAELSRAEPPADLDERYVLKRSTSVRAEQAATIPSWPSRLDDAAQEAYENLQDELHTEPAHQVGGHPDEIQGDMQDACALVSKGIYLGGPSDLPEPELERLTADANEWKLLLQLTTDDELEWMWGDVGNLYFWMRHADIEAGRWDAAWFQLQCS